MIQSPKISTYLKLSDRQLQDIEQKCRDANEELKRAIREHEKIVEEKRSELRRILSESMNDTQKAQLSNLIGSKIDGLFYRSDLQYMHKITLEPKQKN